MKKFIVFSLAVLAMGLELTIPSAFAQTSNGTLVGTVTDQSGAAIANATVKVTSVQLSVERRTTTDTAGTYRMDSLPPGSYSVAISASGFQTLTINGVLLQASVSTRADGKLKIGTMNTSVTVEATAGQTIDTQSGQLGESLSSTEVDDLPYTSLNPASLALTLPGVQDGNGFGFSNGVNYSVNGTRPRANNFLIDGQDDNDNAINGQAFQPINVGAIQNFTVLTNAYSAEFGRGGGSVANYVYKSGTNNFHGQAWEINRDSEFAATLAENAFVGSGKPVDIENTFGFALGGPAIHDKLFFFGSAQWDRERQTANGDTLLIPTANGIATLQTLLPNPNVSLLLASLGNLVSSGAQGLTSVPLGPDSNGVDRGSVEESFFQRSGVSEAANDRQWNARLDWHASPSDTLTGSFIRDDNTLTPDFFNNAGALPPFDSEQGGTSQLFRGQWTRSISPQAVNELRFSYTNIGFTFGPTAATAVNALFNIPEIDFASDSGLPSLGFNGALPQGRAHKTWQAQDAVSYSFGRHTIKGGVDLTFLSVVDQVPFNSRGDLSFHKGGNFTETNGTTGIFTSLANFVDNLSGEGGSISRVFGNPVIRPSVTMYAPYIQDTWRPKDNLSLDFGLRYEYWGTVADILPFPGVNAALGIGLPGAAFPNVFASEQQPNTKNYAPRFSFAYTPHWGGRFFGNDKTVFRGGYGIFYDGLFTNIIDNTDASSPNANGATLTAGQSGRGLANAFGQFRAIQAVPDPFASVSTMSNKTLNPLTQQWNLNMQRELPSKFVVTAAYVGTRGNHLFVNQEFNPGTNAVDANSNLILTNPNLGFVAVRDNGGDSYYHSGQLEVERRFASDFLVRGSYTYSKFIDDGSEVFITTGGRSSFAQNAFCQRCDRGPSAYDRRHRFVAAYIWSLPYSRRNSLLKWLTDQYQWSGIVTVQSGSPNTVIDGFDLNGDGHSADRPDVGNPKIPISASTVGVDGVLLGQAPRTFFGPARNCLFGLSGCTQVSASSLSLFIPASGDGTLGRNSVFGPGQFFLDMSVERRFLIPIGKLESQALTFRCEAFNVLNHPNLFTPTFNILSSHFAQTAPTIAGGRQIKFWLKYEF